MPSRSLVLSLLLAGLLLGRGTPAAAETALLPASGPAAGEGLMATVDGWMATVNAGMAAVFFFDVWFWDGIGEGRTVPLAVFLLVCGAIFFTVRMGFPQLRAFRHAIHLVRGKYRSPEDPGEVTSFQALSAALSATVGLGNIGGVAIAVCTGGPGATFWMILAGFLGMAAKFTECTLGQMYRETRPDGRVMGGAMFYLSKGLREIGLGGAGRVLAVFFAIVCIGASFGGGNTFQVSQSLGAVGRTIPFLATYPWIYGLVLAFLVGIVILGGLRRIAATAERIVPFMCILYVLACLAILFLNVAHVPRAFHAIVAGAFTPGAAFGGFLGVIVQGFRRAAFSNEAGVGSAAIAHSAAQVKHPVQEGIVALLEPFVDTVVICTMTALVIVITGAYENPAYEVFRANNNGAALTSAAMGEVLPFMPYVLALAVFLFAYSTMISWSYYGERCWAYLFGDGTSVIYRVIFVVFVLIGSIVTATNILNFGDLLIFGMVFPNIVGVVLLSGKVKRQFAAYWSRYRAGELPIYK
ncbi:MAG: alanine/glycine:cation symporter family protein [Planctomycetota bacterium]